MRMMGTTLAAIMLVAATVSVCLSEEAAPPAAPGMEQQHAAAITKSVYTCPHCHTVATAAGKCATCSMDMQEQRLLGVKDGKATLCACASGCGMCDAKGVKDGKCACGKEVNKGSLKGMHVCREGCPVVSDKSGKCGGCGKELKEAE